MLVTKLGGQGRDSGSGLDFRLIREEKGRRQFVEFWPRLGKKEVLVGMRRGCG